MSKQKVNLLQSIATKIAIPFKAKFYYYCPKSFILWELPFCQRGLSPKMKCLINPNSVQLRLVQTSCLALQTSAPQRNRKFPIFVTMHCASCCLQHIHSQSERAFNQSLVTCKYKLITSIYRNCQRVKSGGKVIVNDYGELVGPIQRNSFRIQV